MKGSALGAVATCLTAATLAAAGVEVEDARPGLAVLPAENRVESLWWAGVGARAAQEIFLERLAMDGRYRVMERSEAEAKLQENRVWLSGELSPAGVVKVSRLLGVRYVLTGALTEYRLGRVARGTRRDRRRLALAGKKFLVAFELRLMDGETGAIVWADGGRGEAPAEAWSAADVDKSTDAEATMFNLALRPLLENLADRLVEAQLLETP